MKKIILSIVLAAGSIFVINNFTFAQDQECLVELKKLVSDTVADSGFKPPFSELRNLCSECGKFKELVDFLQWLASEKKISEARSKYCIALTRYYHLKCLEEKQGWDEYFNQGNAYREDLVSKSNDAISLTKPKDAINIYARLLQWQFYRDQQEADSDTALDELMNACSVYSKESKDQALIKEVADQLSLSDEKSKSRELYKLYALSIANSDVNKEQLLGVAEGFYKEANLELSETLYDVYIDRIIKSADKEKAAEELAKIVKIFAYQDSGTSDPFYAEKVFKKIEELGGKEVFSEALMYLRAFNLEKSKEFQGARDAYLALIQRFPASAHINEALFKAGVISTYILRTAEEGKKYFTQLTQIEKIDPHIISAFYQLGLLSQWAGATDPAKELYAKLIEKAGSAYQETVNLARERLQEIEQGKSLEYNLKNFLDTSLKSEYANLQFGKSALSGSAHIGAPKQEVKVRSAAQNDGGGCMQIAVQYLWSGDLGSTKPSIEVPSFVTVYQDPGTKVIGLVVVSPNGIIDRDMDLVDIR